VDVFCTNAAHEDDDLAAKVQAAGAEFWQYGGCDDHSPAHWARWEYGWYFAACGSRGSLIWAYDAMCRFDTSEGNNWGYGWSTPFGMVPTPYLIGIREGWDDRRWIEAYERVVISGNPAARGLLDGMLARAHEQRTRAAKAGRPAVEGDLLFHTRMDAWRAQLADAIVEAQTNRNEH